VVIARSTIADLARCTQLAYAALARGTGTDGPA
jgi:hypothetical protein